MEDADPEKSLKSRIRIRNEADADSGSVLINYQSEPDSSFNLGSFQ